MSALAWLNDLVQWFGKLFPRLTMVPPTHRGVLFGPKGGAKEKGPGLVLWWPIIQELRQVPVTVQSIQVCARCMPHKLSASSAVLVPKVSICGLAIQYRVVDAVKSAVNVLSLHSLVDNRCQAAVGNHWSDLEGARNSVEAAVHEMKPWLVGEFGVELDRVDITHLGTVVGVMQLADWNYSDQDSGMGYEAA